MIVNLSCMIIKNKKPRNSLQGLSYIEFVFSTYSVA